jgi:hypothetical protein
MPLNLHVLYREQDAKLAADDSAYAFVDAVNRWVAKNPEVTTFVYDGLPASYHHWGVTAAWHIAHSSLNSPAYFDGWPEGKKALAREPVVFGAWDAATQDLTLTIRR